MGENEQTEAESKNIGVSQRDLGEMVSRRISFEAIKEALQSGEILENYPDHQRGSCCLISGVTHSERPLHVVCTTALPKLIIITAYEPRMSKWKSPRERNR